MARLQDRIAIVTGGGRGIGLATARRFVEEGATVYVWDLKNRAQSSEIAALQADELPLQYCTVDVRDAELVREAADRINDVHGRVDILINNAGITPGAVELEAVTAELWEPVLAVNLKGALNCVQAVLPHMRRRRYGRIVNTTSVIAECGLPGHTIYGASKSALIGLTRIWARELGSFNITVNAVSPGYIDTQMSAMNPEEVVALVRSRTPLGRIGSADDVAAAHLFLASDEASFITAAILPVSGGLMPT